MVEAHDRLVHDPDAERVQRRAVLELGGEEGDVGRPLAQQRAHVRGAGGRREHREPLVGVLETVAVGAGVRADAVDGVEAVDVGRVVEHAGGEDHGPRALERRRVLDVGVAHLDAVARELRMALRPQLRRREAVVAEHAVHLARRVVARRAGVEHQYAPARAAERERCTEARRPAADDDAIPFVVHATTVTRTAVIGKALCRIGKPYDDSQAEPSPSRSRPWGSEPTTRTGPV